MSIVAAPWRRFVHAARWNGHAPQVTTGAASVSDNHCQASNWSAGIMARATTGTARTVDTTRRSRRARVSSRSSAAAGPGATAPDAVGCGTLAV